MLTSMILVALLTQTPRAPTNPFPTKEIKIHVTELASGIGVLVQGRKFETSNRDSIDFKVDEFDCLVQRDTNQEGFMSFCGDRTGKSLPRITTTWSMLRAPLPKALPAPQKATTPALQTSTGGPTTIIYGLTYSHPTMWIAKGDEPKGPCDLGKLVRAAREHLEFEHPANTKPYCGTLDGPLCVVRLSGDGQKAIARLREEISGCEPAKK